MKLSLLLLLTSFLSFSAADLQAQGQRASPKLTAKGEIKHGANLTITYSSPSVKGRKIWGGLVPFEKVWRAGANEATIFETDKAIKVAGKTLAAGKYSLYAIPGEKSWQFIFNSQTGQWGIERNGETTRKPANDVLVVTVKSKHSNDMQESLLYEINKKGFVLKWENLQVPVSVK